jgi:AhpD family alkylhydroperoxidase
MTSKLNLFTAAPALMKNWMTASQAIVAAVEPTLASLVEIRASQLNGCASCVNMHAAKARAKGESEQHIYLLSVWREAPCYSERERAALAWTDALTQLSNAHTHEAAREALAEHFSEEEQVALTLLINVINGWNRLVVGFGLWVEPEEVANLAAA